MAKSKSTKQSNKGKSSTKPGSSKPQPAATGSRSASSSTNRPAGSRTGARNKGKTTSTRSAFMRGGRRRGGVGTWGLLGLLGVLIVFAVLYFSGVLTPKSGDNNPPVGLSAEISVAEAYALYPDKAFFVDIRETYEYEGGNIPGAINIPQGELESRLNELPSDQDIVVICRSGNRSAEGRKTLVNAGFQNVTSMAGGVSEWKDAGYPFDGDVVK